MAKTLPIGLRLQRQSHPNHPGETVYVVHTSGPKQTKLLREVPFRTLPNEPVIWRTQELLRDLAGENRHYSNPVSLTPEDAVLDADGYVIPQDAEGRAIYDEKLAAAKQRARELDERLAREGR